MTFFGANFQNLFCFQCTTRCILAVYVDMYHFNHPICPVYRFFHQYFLYFMMFLVIFFSQESPGKNQQVVIDIQNSFKYHAQYNSNHTVECQEKTHHFIYIG